MLTDRCSAGDALGAPISAAHTSTSRVRPTDGAIVNAFVLPFPLDSGLAARPVVAEAELDNVDLERVGSASSRRRQGLYRPDIVNRTELCISVCLSVNGAMPALPLLSHRLGGLAKS